MKYVTAVLLSSLATAAFAGGAPASSQALSTGGEVVSSTVGSPTIGTPAMPILVTASQYQSYLRLPGAVHDPVAGTVTVEVTIDGQNKKLTFSQQGGTPVAP